MVKTEVLCGNNWNYWDERTLGSKRIPCLSHSITIHACHFLCIYYTPKEIYGGQWDGSVCVKELTTRAWQPKFNPHTKVEGENRLQKLPFDLYVFMFPYTHQVHTYKQQIIFKRSSEASLKLHTHMYFLIKQKNNMFSYDLFKSLVLFMPPSLSYPLPRSPLFSPTIPFMAPMFYYPPVSSYLPLLLPWSPCTFCRIYDDLKEKLLGISMKEFPN